jgi:1-acyl-sn-glycerol-3-phosphate acyltransferase
VPAVIAAIRTLTTVVLVTIYLFVCGPLLLLWTLISGNTRPLYIGAAGGVRLGFVLAGIRLKVIGEEHTRGTAAVYATNHNSNVDGPAVFYALRREFPRVRILYKWEMRRLPVLVWAFDQAGFVPLQRANPSQSRPAIEGAAQAIREGNSFVIFPEGTRSRTGALLPFKKGGFVMALKSQAPVIPVVVSGGREAMRKGSPLIWPATVTVNFGAPIPTAGLTDDDRETLIGRVRTSMEARLPAQESAR